MEHPEKSQDDEINALKVRALQILDLSEVIFMKFNESQMSFFWTHVSEGVTLSSLSFHQK